MAPPEAPFDFRTIVDRAKKATVAIAAMLPDRDGRPAHDQPFTILGSGFCVHPRGVVLTCRHVLEMFLIESAKIDAMVKETQATGKPSPRTTVKSVQPFAIFFLPQPDTAQVIAACVGATGCIAGPDIDVAALRLGQHEAFPGEFPTVPFEDYEDIHEGMDVGTYGFPKGNLLYEELGTVSSSLSKGSISSIIPIAGLQAKHVEAFQLHLTATHGNSGGPVFSLETGKAFGVLQGGALDKRGHLLFSTAESVYRLVDGMIANALRLS